MRRWNFALVAMTGASLLGAAAAFAQADKSIEGIEKYREALKDGNPAELFEASGEELWKKPAGPNNVSLEKCDLGLGAGVVDGAYAQLPRYFKDTDKVQDAESRVLTCMSTLQGVDVSKYVNANWASPEKDQLNAIATFIAGMSKDKPVKISLAHPKEQQSFNMGRRMFYFEGGPHDFACATCHGQEGVRIRLQDLPNIPTKKGAAAGWTSWPAYRVSSGQMWGMQWRLADCFRQQRFPEPIYGSDVTVALSMYMAATSNGAVMATPGIKR